MNSKKMISNLACLVLMSALENSASALEVDNARYDQDGPFFVDGEYAAGLKPPPPLRAQMNPDGRVMQFGMPMKAIIVDPTVRFNTHQIKAPSSFISSQPNASSSTFSITYNANGTQDPWGAICSTTPDGAKAAFNAAGSIWSNIVKSTVPIKIQVCWSNIGSSNILGYAGGGSLLRDFSGATMANTWYSESLANSLSGTELDGSKPDMYITYNSGFSWYYGTDANPPSNQFDLVTVATHEIAHGLNFAGTMQYSTGVGSWGYGSGYPGIYDRFVENGAGTSILNSTNYPNSTSALGTALTSQDLWFDGANASAANGGGRVKIYAPSTWASGSSYSHLDYNTFNGTANGLMTYAISMGVAQHNPGPVTIGMLKDMGWQIASSANSSLRLINIATRGSVGTGDYVLIGGFVIGGDSVGKKKVVLRGIGLSMPTNVPNRLVDPEILLFNGATQIAYNNNWGSSVYAQELVELGLSPGNSSESAILIDLDPGPYTFHLRGVGGTTGMGLVEVYSIE